MLHPPKDELPLWKQTPLRVAMAEPIQIVQQDLHTARAELFRRLINHRSCAIARHLVLAVPFLQRCVCVFRCASVCVCVCACEWMGQMYTHGRSSCAHVCACARACSCVSRSRVHLMSCHRMVFQFQAKRCDTAKMPVIGHPAHSLPTTAAPKQTKPPQT